MGIIDVIKGFFGTTEAEKPKEEIRFEGLKDWIDRQIDEKRKDLDSKLNEYKSKIDEEKSRVRENVEKLENEEPKNKDVPGRLKQILEGNRETFVQKISVILENLKLPNDYAHIEKFYSGFDREMESFSKSIAKSHNVVSEFFPKEAGIVTEGIKNLDRLVKNTHKSFVDSGILDLENLRTTLLGIHNKSEEKSKLETGLNSEEKSLEDGRSEFERRRKGLEKIRESDENKKYEELKASEDEIKSEFDRLEGQLFHTFSMVESAFKKYEKLSENKTVQSYISDPVSALVKDKNLDILDVVDSIRKGVTRGEVDLKDKKKDKTLRELGKLSRTYFEEFIQKRGELEDRKERIDLELAGIKIEEELKEHVKELKEREENLERKKRAIEEIKKKIGLLDIRRMKEDLVEKVREKFSNVKVILSS